MKRLFIVFAIMLLSCVDVFASQVGVTTSPLKGSPINVFNESGTNLIFILPVNIQVEIIDLNPLKNVPYSTFIKVKVLQGEHKGEIGLVGEDLIIPEK